MMPADLPAVLAIADAVHPNYPEDPTVFAERLALYPDGCMVLMRDDRAVGYLVSHPWAYAQPPALNSLLGALPVSPTTYYIHDIALLPEARGTGGANAVVARLIALAGALGVGNISLVAVNDSVAFWARHGFHVVFDRALDKKLRSYDADARLMVQQCAETRA
jgi:ribosomal protein S18 acetylase RimI-like enzyme